MSTILLTGAAGFIGRRFLSQALSSGHDVRAVVRDVAKSNLTAHDRLSVIGGGLAVPSVEDIRGCDILVHFAAHGVNGGMDDWTECFRVNVMESLALWRRAAAAGVRRFLICGSCFEYGRSGERYDFIPVHAPLEPTGAYHASKAAATVAALGLAVELKLELAILRPFHVFGDGEAPSRFWPSLRTAALAGRDFEMTAGEQIRDFQPVQEAAEAFLRAAVDLPLQPGRPLVRNLGTGRPQTLADFASVWWKNFGASGRLLLGCVPYRRDEVMRYVPLIDSQDGART
jgi:UDP-glucose 4-epimerase